MSGCEFDQRENGWRKRRLQPDRSYRHQNTLTQASTVSSESNDPSHRMRRITALTTAALLGVATSIVGLLAIIVFRHQGTLPKLAPADFYEARQRWEENGPANYNIRVNVTGRQAAVYYAEVRDGRVFAATRNGDVLSRHRTIDTWTVPGMFTTIHSDVINVEKHATGKADQSTPQVLLRGSFDEDTGVPLHYHRTELRKWGPNVEVTWNVTNFEVLEE